MCSSYCPCIPEAKSLYSTAVQNAHYWTGDYNTYETCLEDLRGTGIPEEYYPSETVLTIMRIIEEEF